MNLSQKLAIVLGLLAAVCIGVSVWLYVITARFYDSDAYAPGWSSMAYSVRGVEADGSGIFMPAALLLVLGIGLAKWAWNLWRSKF